MADNESNNSGEDTTSGDAEDPTTDALEAALAELESGMQDGDEAAEAGAPQADDGDDGPPPALKKRQAVRAVTKTRNRPGEKGDHPVIKQKPKSRKRKMAKQDPCGPRKKVRPLTGGNGARGSGIGKRRPKKRPPNTPKKAKPLPPPPKAKTKCFDEPPNKLKCKRQKALPVKEKEEEKEEEKKSRP